MSKRQQTITIAIDEARKIRLEAIATELECFWGQSAKRVPNLSNMFRELADGELIVIRKEKMKELTLLKPAAHLCQQCAVEHEDGQPHNWESLYWHFWFLGEHGRDATLADAFAHCSTEVKEGWKEALLSAGHTDLAIKLGGQK